MFIELALTHMPQKLQSLCLILQQASTLLKQEFQHYCDGAVFEIEQKSDQSPVTQADLKVNAFLQAQLHQFSALPILSEEDSTQHHQHWQQFWLLDPLDGTKEFLHHKHDFCINLSLIDRGVSVISAIAVPMQHRIYIAAQGQLPFRCQWFADQPALHWTQYQQPTAMSGPLRIALSPRADSAPYQDFLNFLAQQQLPYQTLEVGSAYKFCLMLESQVDVYPRFHPTYEWDTAAGQGLLESIGGTVVNLQQQPLIYNQSAQLLNPSFMALRRAQDWPLLAQFCQTQLSKN
jgi:3'(2'), 5'-bisphosphate nucleotidase